MQMLAQPQNAACAGANWAFVMGNARRDGGCGMGAWPVLTWSVSPLGTEQAADVDRAFSPPQQDLVQAWNPTAHARPVSMQVGDTRTCEVGGPPK